MENFYKAEAALAEVIAGKTGLDYCTDQSNTLDPALGMDLRLDL